MITAAEAYYNSLEVRDKQTVDFVLSVIKRASERGETSVDLLDEDNFCRWWLLKHWDHILILLGYTITPIKNEYEDIVGYKINW